MTSEYSNCNLISLIAVRLFIKTFFLPITYYLLPIGDKLRLKASCQEGNGDKSRVGLARFGRVDLTIPKSRFLGEIR